MVVTGLPERGPADDLPSELRLVVHYDGNLCEQSILRLGSSLMLHMCVRMYLDFMM